jgi:glycosyltransferase involved in cell wall biosynthesis
LRPLNLLVDEVRLWRAFENASRTSPFDLVEVIDWNVAATLSVARVRHGALLVKIHGPSEYIARLNGKKLRALGRFLAWRERWIARKSDLLLCADPFLAREIAKIWKLPRPPDTIPDPVHVPDLDSSFRLTDGTGLRILAVGRLERRKDQASLLRALGRLAELDTSWSATLVGPDTQTGPGEGSYKSFLLQMVSEGVREKLTWIDHVPHEQLWTLYLRSDIVVVCQVDGGYNYATLEPMSVGCPVITTDAGAGAASPYVRHAETAWVYRAGDDAGLAEALRALSNQPDLRARLGAAARIYINQELSPEHIAEQVLSRIGLGAARSSPTP